MAQLWVVIARERWRWLALWRVPWVGGRACRGWRCALSLRGLLLTLRGLLLCELRVVLVDHILHLLLCLHALDFHLSLCGSPVCICHGPDSPAHTRQEASCL